MRLAILGFGSIGRRHARNLTSLGQTDLLVFDPDPGARAALEGLPGASWVGSLEELWPRKPQAVLVCSPPRHHVALALEAARRGCDLFIEKPLSHAREDVGQLSAEIEKRGLVSMVGCNMRFHPGPSKVKALLDEQAIGRVISARIFTGSYLPDWRPGTDYRRSYSASEAMGGGAILDCIHEIDLALWYFGPGHVIAAATAPASSIGLEVEGLAEILIRHETGALSSVHVNFVQRDYSRGCQVIGTDGSLSWDFGKGGVLWHGADGRQRARYEQPSDWNLNQMYAEEMRHFLDSLESRRGTLGTLDEGLRALDVALCAKTMGSKAFAGTT